jgi:hypothetical protein
VRLIVLRDAGSWWWTERRIAWCHASQPPAASLGDSLKSAIQINDLISR